MQSKEIIIIKKPRGRPPKNKIWDQQKGIWLDNTTNSTTELSNINSSTLPQNSKQLKYLFWNINGIRAINRSDKKVYEQLSFLDYLKDVNPDVICFAETKISKDQDVKQVDSQILADYKYRYWNCSKVKHGYSGTAIFSKIKPISINYGLSSKDRDDEGRVITAEFENHYLVIVYTPNSGEGLIRLKYRVENWDNLFRQYVSQLDTKKPVIICGDLNCAHHEIDIHNPKTNLKSAGFTIEERNSFTKLLEAGFVDTFRHQHPKEIKYSYWTYLRNARDRNIGWRIDYFLVSPKIQNSIIDSTIEDQIKGSDHAPIILSFTNT